VHDAYGHAEVFGRGRGLKSTVVKIDMRFAQTMRSELNVRCPRRGSGLQGSICPCVQGQSHEIGIDAVRGIHVQNLAR
jgi:hypothetical protein